MPGAVNGIRPPVRDGFSTDPSLFYVTFAAQSGSAIGNLHSDRETSNVTVRRSASTSRLLGPDSDQNL